MKLTHITGTLVNNQLKVYDGVLFVIFQSFDNIKSLTLGDCYSCVQVHILNDSREIPSSCKLNYLVT